MFKVPIISEVYLIKFEMMSKLNTSFTTCVAASKDLLIGLKQSQASHVKRHHVIMFCATLSFCNLRGPLVLSDLVLSNLAYHHHLTKRPTARYGLLLTGRFRQ